MREVGEQIRTVHVTVQGKAISLACSDVVMPTVFSTFLANTMRLRPTDRTVCDLGAGGGVLAIALALLGAERVVAIDRSLDACELTRENAKRNGVEERVDVVHAELSELPPAEFDLVVSNPPTMPVGPSTPDFAAGTVVPGETFVDLLVAGLPGWLAESGSAQVALSSLVEADVLDQFRLAGFEAEPRTTLIVPFRPFYLDAYSSEDIAGFLASAQVLPEGDPEAGAVSELVTVYEFRRAA